MTDEKDLHEFNLTDNELSDNKCDKYDYLIAGFCGAAAGLIDIIFVGDPATSKLMPKTDMSADKFVQKTVEIFWKNDKRPNRNKHCPDTLEKSISYLEQAFPVNYDARYAKDLIVEDGVLSNMNPKNHHLLSLAHSPDIIGLIFSIIDQFNPGGAATFVDHGKIINVVPKKTSGAVPYLQGSDIHSKLFCGFVNWIGHLLSDLVGSSKTRAKDNKRGAGIPIPFYELFLGCEFGPEDGKKLSELMIDVFEEGYDARFGVTMAIPVVIEELMIRAIWVIRQKFIRKLPLKDCLPTDKHADLRLMLIIGNSTLCLIDGMDAGVRGLARGNAVTFVCRLNIVGWARLVSLVFKELKIKFGPVIEDKLKQFISDVVSGIDIFDERQRLIDFYNRINELDNQLDEAFREFVELTEKQYKLLYLEIDSTFDADLSVTENAEHSVKLAEISGVDNSNIIKSENDLDNFFLN